MMFPDDDGLPLWLFILVILLTAGTIALVLFVVWRKCIKRKSGLEPVSSGISELPVRKISVRRGHIIRASWNVSLTGSRFGGASRGQSRRPSPQWPETVYLGGHQDKPQKPGYHHSVRNVPSFEDYPASTSRRSWSDFLRRQSRVGVTSDQESTRASYISFSVDHRKPGTSLSKPPFSDIERPWLDSPALMSPITPVTLPRTRQSAASCHTSPRLLSEYASVPPLLTKYRVSRYREELNSVGRRKQIDPKRLDLRLSSSRSQSQEYRSSAATNSTFLQAWSNVYRDWLLYPEGPSSGEPAKPTSHHIDRISIANPASEALDDRESGVSLPSSAPVSSTKSMSAVSSTHSRRTKSCSSDRREEGRTLGKPLNIRREEISWLVED